MSVVRIALPAHLRTLAGVTGPEVRVDVAGEPTVASLLDALEAAHPALRGTIRDRATARRRPYIRYHACGSDLSFAAEDDRLPDEVARGVAPFLVVGAISGG